jgi:uncharacterized protein (DUF2225 family)
MELNKAENTFRPKVTFLSKEHITCPVCETHIYKENLMTGSGRLIAGDITTLLHRTFKPSQVYGKIYPLVYYIIVCPNCFFASLPTDFNKVMSNKIDILSEKRVERMDIIQKMVGEDIDFTKHRTLHSGAASYVLAAICYDFINKKSIPVLKQAICSMRAGFLFEDLDKENPYQYFDYLAEICYKKALFFYNRAFELDMKKEQLIENVSVLGPDIDKDYGYDGLLYLTNALKFTYGDRKNSEKRITDLEDMKSGFGKLFGMGKANVNKPKEILEKSKNFYELVSKELKELKGNTDKDNTP